MESELDIIKAIKYLTNKISDDEKQQFEVWLNKSGTNAAQFDKFSQFWEVAGKAYNNYSPDIIKGWKTVKPKTTEKNKEQEKNKSKSYNFLKIAASILIIVSLVISINFMFDRWQHESFRTFSSGNNIVSISLSDGSIVWLNAQSELRVPQNFRGHKRIAFLKGEGFFKVAKNTKMPFIIYARKSITEVLGTSFNIRAKELDSIISISVVTGKVSFYEQINSSEKIIVLPGQKGCFNVASRFLYMKPNDNKNFMAWKTRIFDFRNASLHEVCDALSDYYNIKIEPGVYSKDSRFSFTGTFTNASLNELLNVIELTLGIKFVKSGNIIKIKR